MPALFEAARRADKASFYCPCGHSLSFRENEADKLRREVQILTQQQARYEGEIGQLRTAYNEAEARAAKERRARDRIEKRIKNGVCPDCNRTFTDLQRHMAKKHAPKCEVVQLKEVGHESSPTQRSKQ
jgi:hypothetical protein